MLYVYYVSEALCVLIVVVITLSQYIYTWDDVMGRVVKEVKKVRGGIKDNDIREHVYLIGT